MSDPGSQETARIVLALDAAIAAIRVGKSTGWPTLDAAMRMSREHTEDAVLEHAARASGTTRVPPQPNRVELAIVTALADTYGSEVLTNASLAYAVGLAGRRGGIALVQRVLWGDSDADMQLASMLTACRGAFTQIVFAWPNVFFAEANAVIAGFMPRPPAPPKSAAGPSDE